MARAVDYTLDGIDYRLEIEYVQIFPASQHFGVHLRRINKSDYSVRGFSLSSTDAEWITFVGQTVNGNLGSELQGVVITYVQAHMDFDIALNGGQPLPSDWVRPTLTPI